MASAKIRRRALFDLHPDTNAVAGGDPLARLEVVRTIENRAESL